jgi:hypothetical protein
MPTVAQYRALEQRYQDEKHRATVYLAEGKGLKEACAHYENKIADLERANASLQALVSGPTGKVTDDRPEPWMEALYVNNGFLPSLKESLTRQLVYTERQREGYARILASIPAGNATIQTYYDQYEEQVNGLRELLHEVERVLR